MNAWRSITCILVILRGEKSFFKRVIWQNCWTEQGCCLLCCLYILLCWFFPRNALSQSWNGTWMKMKREMKRSRLPLLCSITACPFLSASFPLSCLFSRRSSGKDYSLIAQTLLQLHPVCVCNHIQQPLCWWANDSHRNKRINMTLSFIKPWNQWWIALGLTSF